VVLTSFNFCTAAFIFMMGCGFLTFGGASQGLILNNYAEQVRPSIRSTAVFLLAQPTHIHQPQPQAWL